MPQAKQLKTRTHKGGTGGVALATSRIPTAEDEVQQLLQPGRMAHNQAESV